MAPGPQETTRQRGGDAARGEGSGVDASAGILMRRLRQCRRMDSVERLAEDVLASRARRHPSWATQAGLRGHDARLRESSAQAIAEEAAEIQGLLARAHALVPSVERDALVTMLSLELFELAETRTWARNPDLAAEYFDHLFSLLLAAHLPPAERLAALSGRLDGCERYFLEGWDRFDPAVVPPLWVEGAMQSVDGAPAFLDAVRAFAREAGASGVARARIEDGLARAAGVIERHRAWLRDLHPQARGEPALGAKRFETLLQLRRIDEPADALLRMGEELTARFRREVDEAALTVLAAHGREPGDDPAAEALALVRADHPASFAEVLRFYEASIREARAFVIERGLATPTDTPLDVLETPAFLRHLVPFAAYVGPARFATPRRGVYLVTPKVDLSAFPRADVRNTTVHEAWPGHHLQLAAAAERAGLVGYLADAVDLVEGWALYCEAVMGEHGYTAAPAERFIRARDALWRAVRITLDVGLHTGRLAPPEAAAVLSRETGMAEDEAAAEVLRYTLSPGYNLSYMYGRRRLEALRERHARAGGSARTFHDAVLRAGSLPVALLERVLAEDSPDMRYP